MLESKAERDKSMSAEELLDFVISSGRVLVDEETGKLDKDSLIAEIEFAANEEGLDVVECVDYAVKHIRTN